MTVINYDFIKSIPNISENNIDDPRIKKIQYANLELIKYKKNTLRNNEDFEKYGLLRSIILHQNKIVAVSPGKSMNFDIFKEKYNSKDCIAEEFIEGTMINLFYTKEHEWHISTKSNIGGNNVYFKKGKMKKTDTFAYMFNEVCKEHNIDFDKLPQKYCYSFVFQHPRNRIVTKFNETKLYLIAVYELIDDYTVKKININDELDDLFKSNEMLINYPQKYEFNEYDELNDLVENELKHYENVGIMIYEKNGYNRTKIRNMEYENVRRLKGNQPKLQFHHLELKKTNDIEKYLKYFPEDKELFEKFEKEYDQFKNTLFQFYVSCFIYKKKHLKEYPMEYKNHLYQLHENYKNTGKRITNKTINKYIESTD